MNQKNKAEELLKKMNVIHHMTLGKKGAKLPVSMYDSQIKQCALVAVDEIISAVKTTTGHCELRKLDWHEVQSDLGYWADVKQEIEKFKKP